MSTMRIAMLEGAYAPGGAWIPKGETKSVPFWAGLQLVSERKALDVDGAALAMVGSLAPVPLEFAHNVAPMLAAIRNIGTQRTVLSWPGMSIVAGVGATDALGFDWTVARTQSVAPVLGALLTAKYGGVQSYGVESVYFHSAGNAWSGVSPTNYGFIGPRGTAISLAGGSGTPAVLTATTTRPNQQVKVFGEVSGGAGAVTLQYSLTGANFQAVTNLPASTPAAPLWDAGISTQTRWWHDPVITLPVAGVSNIGMRPSVTAGHNFNFWGADLDWDLQALPGITIHRAAQSSLSLADICAAALDGADTQPAGSWITGGTVQERRYSQPRSITTRLGADYLFCSYDVNAIQMYAAQGLSLADQGRQVGNFIAWLAAQGKKVIFNTALSVRDPAAYTGNPPYSQWSIINQLRGLCAASSNAAMIDLMGWWAGATLAERYAAQVSDPTFFVDGLHPARPGIRTLAAITAASLIGA